MFMGVHGQGDTVPDRGRGATWCLLQGVWRDVFENFDTIWVTGAWVC